MDPKLLVETGRKSPEGRDDATDGRSTRCAGEAAGTTLLNSWSTLAMPGTSISASFCTMVDTLLKRYSKNA